MPVYLVRPAAVAGGVGSWCVAVAAAPESSIISTKTFTRSDVFFKEQSVVFPVRFPFTPTLGSVLVSGEEVQLTRGDGELLGSYQLP